MASNTNPSTLTAARLAPELLTLGQQAHLVTDTARVCVFRPADQKVPRWEDTERCFDVLQECSARVQGLLATFDRAESDGTEGRKIDIQFARQARSFDGLTHINQLARRTFTSRCRLHTGYCWHDVTLN